MNDNFIKNLSRTKRRHRERMAKLPFEEKVKIVIELQKIDIEMRKASNRTIKSIQRVWEIDY